MAYSMHSDAAQNRAKYRHVPFTAEEYDGIRKLQEEWAAKVIGDDLAELRTRLFANARPFTENEILDKTAVASIGDAAYGDGYQAINNDCHCPYEEGTPEHDRWWEGFHDGVETLHED